MAKQTSRIYVVDGNRLVRAATSISARNHVAKDLITSELASQDTIFELAGKGVKIEDATTPPAEQGKFPFPMDGSAAGVTGDGSSAPAEVCAANPLVGIPGLGNVVEG